jgi:hypothetical protein
MPLDASLPASQLARATAEEILRHFHAAYSVRVDLEDVPAAERLSLVGARLPEPPEARLLDRVLQVVPPGLRRAVDRILIVDNGVAGQYGGYRSGIIRIYTPALRLTLADPAAASRYSYFTTTVLHELGHAVYDRLSADQRGAVADLYLDFLIEGLPASVEPTPKGAEHYFVDLVVAALLGLGAHGMGVNAVRERVRALGIELR